MEIKLARGEKYTETKWVKIQIGQTQYVLSQTSDGHLEINKHSDSGSSRITVHPKCANEIDVS